MKIHSEKAILLAVLQPKGFVQDLQPLTILQPHFHCAFTGKINIPANRQDLNQAKKFPLYFSCLQGWDIGKRDIVLLGKLDLSNLVPSLYFIRFYSADGTFLRRVLIK